MYQLDENFLKCQIQERGYDYIGVSVNTAGASRKGKNLVEED